jgi:signal peptidase I
VSGRYPAARPPAGGQRNGAVPNGRPSDGLTQNGLSQNGLTQNGLSQNGLTQNGLTQNGLPTNGTGRNGAYSTGSSGNGVPVDGAHAAGPSPNGAYPNGSRANGAPSRGTPTNGATADGVNTGGPNGSGGYRNGAIGPAPNGRPAYGEPVQPLPDAYGGPSNGRAPDAPVNGGASRTGGQPQRSGPAHPALPEPRRPAAPAPSAPRRRPEPTDDEPTVVHGKLVNAPDPDEAPGRHRRRAGESSTGRPASSYRDQAAADGFKPKRGRRRRPAFWKELPLLIVVALLLTFLIQTFLAKVYVIPSGSMETTLHGCTGCNNDRVLVDKVTYRFSDPRPGDVVVFRGPDSWNSEFTADPPSNIVVQGLQQLGSLIGLAPPDEKDFVKRVIAVGGQTVACCDSRNRVTVDGKPLNEPYIYYLPEAGQARQDTFSPVTIPQGELWMMGDSRNNSADSRVPGHGPVPVANVIGKARLIVLPFSRFGSIPDPNPQTTAVGMAAPGSQGSAPLALGLVGALPLLLGRRRLDRLDKELDSFLPGRGRSRRRPDRRRSRRR